MPRASMPRPSLLKSRRWITRVSHARISAGAESADDVKVLTAAFAAGRNIRIKSRGNAAAKERGRPITRTRAFIRREDYRDAFDVD